MHRFVRLLSPPDNLPDFVAEILPPFGALYGQAAAAHYEQTAQAGISTAITSPEITTFACMHGDGAAALLLARRETSRTTIAFFHVLEPYQNAGIGEELLDAYLETLLEESGAIATDFVPFHPMALDAIFKRHGFVEIPRSIMRRPTSSGALILPVGYEVLPAGPETLGDLAATMAETYALHPERFLFAEVQSEAGALHYLNRVHLGVMGRHVPAYTRAAWFETQCVGLALGCQVLPGLGFVLHMAVRPAFQGRGLGSALLGALCASFAEEGLDFIALGVTCDNPAVNLYERAGFSAIARVPVYFRT